MKYVLSLLIVVASFTALQSQTQNSPISSANEVYLEWMSENAVKVMTDIKDGQETLDGDQILDENGNSFSEKFLSGDFDITAFDFDQVIAPEKNILIRVSDDKCVFIKSKHRQEVLFERYQINQAAKK